MTGFIDRKTQAVGELNFTDAQGVIDFAAKALSVGADENPNTWFVLLERLQTALGEPQLQAFVEYARNVMLLRTHHHQTVGAYFEPDRLKTAQAEMRGIVSDAEIDYYAQEADKIRRLHAKLGHKFFPRVHGLFADVEAACDQFLMADMPTAALIGPQTAIYTMGSCFAQNISRFLSAVLKLGAMHIQVGEELDAVSFLHTVERLDAERPKVVASLSEAAEPLLIYTIGIAEILADQHGTYSVGSLKNNPALARRKTATVQSPVEIATQLDTAFAALRQINPRLKVVVTVSPVPLEASFRKDLSILAADCLSKSTLRHAANLVTRPEAGIYYFPSFEFVRWLCPLIGYQPFAEDDGHPRHVSNRVVTAICLLFIKYFATPDIHAQCTQRVCAINATRDGSFDFD